MKMASCCLNTSCHYCRSLHEVSSSKKMTEKNAFFVKFMQVNFCDLQGHRRSQVMVRIEKAIYEFLSMNNCNYGPKWHPYKDNHT